MSVFFKSEHQAPAAEIQELWEEVFLLVDATDEEDAKTCAKEIARSREHTYVVSDPVSHVLRWSFMKVERSYLVESAFEHGAEIFARFLRPSEAESLLTPFEE